jgi:programmed cell death 6-interacting protein
MLPVPLKKPTTTASDVELGPPLFRLVERTVGESEAFRHTDDFSALDSLRAAAVRAEAFSEAGVAAAANYAAALMAAERRLPDAQEDVAVPFGWHDAFKPASSAAVAALGYERAAVVFNCGALYSLGACTCDRSDGEGLKVACRRFQL